MSANTSIQWTDRTWNPVRGCSRVSPGCDNCYAMRVAHRFSNTVNGKPGPYQGLTTIRRGKVDWAGMARFIPSELAAPLRWRKPQRIFVNSMSDLFHHSLSDEEIAAVFGVMAACPQHTFQVLTKRPERAREWFAWYAEKTGTRYAPCGLAVVHASQRLARDYADFMPNLLVDWPVWPLPNVWLGVSVENQETADQRIPLLLGTPAAVRFISAEPLLGEIDLRAYLSGGRKLHVCLDIAGALRNGGNSLDGFTGANGRKLSRDEAKQELRKALATGARVLPMGECDDFSDQTGCRGHEHPKLGWVIVGGESGHGARSFDVAWARSLVEQCRAAGVACFVKQLGAKPYQSVSAETRGMGGVGLALKDSKGGDWSEWAPELRVREFPGVGRR